MSSAGPELAQLELLEAEPASWPQSAQALLARRILPHYMRLGPARFVCNANVELRALRVADQVLPFVYQQRDGTGGTTDVCSPWSHYLRYPLEEIARHGHGLGALWGRLLLYASIPFLLAFTIEDVVSVNNWLFTTNPQPALDRAAVGRLTAALREQFPQRAIVFRTVNPEIGKELSTHLVACGYRLVASRVVYLLDPASREYRQSRNVRRDRKLLYDGNYEILSHEGFSMADMPRLAELHRLLYIEKHSALNPDFSPLFFETAWRNRLFEFWGLRQDGRIDAYVTFYEFSGLLVANLLGYDTRLPKTLGLYRRSVALATEESRRRGLRLHLSAGAGAFKHHLGARPCIEYDAVFDRHLPLRCRVGWSLLRVAGSLQHRKVRRGW